MDSQPQNNQEQIPKWLKLVPIILGCIAVIELGAIAVLGMTKPSKGEDGPVSNAIEYDENGCLANKVAFDEIDKEYAYAWYKIYYNNQGCAVASFTGDDDLAPEKGGAGNIRLLDSYSDPSEIQEIANRSRLNTDYNKWSGDYSNAIDIQVKQKDKYSVVYAGEKCASDSLCSVGIAFNKNYLYYYSEPVTDTSNGYTSVNVQEKMKIAATDDDDIKKALDLFFVTEHPNLYESSIERDGSEVVYTGKIIGIGADLSPEGYASFLETHEVSMVINLLYFVFRYNTEDDTFDYEYDDEGGILNVAKSFPLTKDEYYDMLGRAPYTTATPQD